MVNGDIITFKNPSHSYQHELYIVWGGWHDQNGFNFHCCSYNHKMVLVILEREAKKVGRLEGDAFYELKDRQRSPIFLGDKDYSNSVYLAEITIN